MFRRKELLKNEDVVVDLPLRAVRSDATPEKPGIAFHATLIDELKDDHVRLVEIYTRAWAEGYQREDFARLSELLNLFKYEFQTHIMKENVKFYVYLEQNMTDPHTLTIIREFRNDMNDIANAVVRFCKTYQMPFFSQALKYKFEKDYAKIGEVLTTRVTLEERDLYSLYSR